MEHMRQSYLINHPEEMKSRQQKQGNSNGCWEVIDSAGLDNGLIISSPSPRVKSDGWRKKPYLRPIRAGGYCCHSVAADWMIMTLICLFSSLCARFFLPRRRSIWSKHFKISKELVEWRWSWWRRHGTDWVASFQEFIWRTRKTFVWQINDSKDIPSS